MMKAPASETEFGHQKSRTREISIDLPSMTYPPAFLIGSTTRLADCWTPGPEIKLLPPCATPAGTVKAAIPEGPTLSTPEDTAGTSARLKSIIHKPRPEPLDSEKLFLDFRLKAPENWAHLLTNHLPLLFLLCEAFELEGDARPVIVLPSTVPGYVVRVLEMLGLTCHLADGPLKGSFLQFDASPWNGNRGSRSDTMARLLKFWPIHGAIQKELASVPRQLFISRKDTRRISNEAEIEAYLTERGFEKVYPEEHSPVRQMAMLCGAEEIAAMHGAGVGPLVMRGAFNAPPLKFLEFFGAGYINNVFRVVTNQVCGEWIGVHGRPTKDMFNHLEAKNRDAREFQESDTELDIASVDLACKMLFDGQAPVLPTLGMTGQ